MEAISNSLKLLFWAFYVLLSAFLCFFIFTAVFLGIAYLNSKGFSKENFEYLMNFWLDLKDPVSQIFSAYKDWFEDLLLWKEQGYIPPLQLLPFFAPLLFFTVTIWAYVKSPYYFNMWYRLNNHFASDKEVKNIGLFEGQLMALGVVDNKIVSPADYSSVFCVAASGLGKTDAVAIPSILESDEASIVAIDVEGNLIKNTMGYRQSLGPVFYFDWTKADNPATGEIYPRWNPLSPKNLPEKGLERDVYVANVAKNLLSRTEKNYWDKMINMAMEGMINCFVSKIEQAIANDYFLSKLLDKGRLSNDDKDVLLSYYALMPSKYTKEAIEALKRGKLTVDSYMPIGSWGEIPKEWQGKELSFPMCADCLMQTYFMVTKDDENKNHDGWKIMLGRFIKEAKFFGYHKRSIQILEYLFYLSPQQRNVIFTVFLEPLSIFRDKAVRERTSMSDFSNDELRGLDNQPVTIYSVASNSNAKFMTKFLVDMLVDTNLNIDEEDIRPLLFVLDDFENLPRFDALKNGLERGRKDKMSFLLLADGLSKLEQTYTAKGLEEIISNATYKLATAENNVKLSEVFIKLARFGRNTTQIPEAGVKELLSVQRAFADANYYKRIAKGLISSGRLGAVSRDRYILLAEGYYHLPIELSSLNFKEYEELLEKSQAPMSEFLDEVFVNRRNVQDLETPEIMAVMKEAGIDVSDEREMEKYIKGRYDETLKKIETMKDKKTVLAEDISERWKSREEGEEASECAKEPSDKDDWWLSEDAFSCPVREENPFKN